MLEHQLYCILANCRSVRDLRKPVSQCNLPRVPSAELVHQFVKAFGARMRGGDKRTIDLFRQKTKSKLVKGG